MYRLTGMRGRIMPGHNSRYCKRGLQVLPRRLTGTGNDEEIEYGSNIRRHSLRGQHRWKFSSSDGMEYRIEYGSPVARWFRQAIIHHNFEPYRTHSVPPKARRRPFIKRFCRPLPWSFSEDNTDNTGASSITKTGGDSGYNTPGNGRPDWVHARSQDNREDNPAYD